MTRKNFYFSNKISHLLYSMKRLCVWILLIPIINSNSSEGVIDRCPIMEIHRDMFKGKMAVGPNDVIKNLMPKGGKNLEYFVELELMLENIADNSSLYDVPLEERDEIMDYLREVPSVKRFIEECEELHLHPPCNTSLYRTLDGTCNNLKYPMWGSTFSEQLRLLPAVYEGAHSFRKSMDGMALPAPRTISLKMKNENHPSTLVSALFTFFGQFVAHDMVMTPVFTRNNELYNCCDSSERNNPRCAPIYYPEDDPFYSILKVDCQNFIRALPYPQCNFEKRSPVAEVNSFLDMSTIYGNNEVDDEVLRRYDSDGRMRTRSSSFGQLLCENEIENEVFCPYNKTCFRSGDHRVNMHTTLTTLHTLFVRLHNVIAESLRQMNDHWNAEKTFQEVRRIVIAIMQRVTYGEYLPLLIGTDLMRKYDLDLNFNEGSLYKEQVNPTLIVEFSAAAFRLHSMIPKNISNSYPEFKFADSFSNFKPLYQGQSDCLVAGSSELPSQKNDRHFIGDVSHDLFRAPGATYGMDQISMNVQRGRDLGLPPYAQFLKHFFNAETSSFDDLKKIMIEDNVDFLKDIYDFAADIDAYVGILTENSIQGLDIGPTAAEIIAMQFHGTKFGDSFYFTHTNGRYPFTTDQMKSIEAFSLTQIICLTTNRVEARQYPLKLPHQIKNPLIPCSSIPTMNPWRDPPLQ